MFQKQLDLRTVRSCGDPDAQPEPFWASKSVAERSLSGMTSEPLHLDSALQIVSEDAELAQVYLLIIEQKEHILPFCVPTSTRERAIFATFLNLRHIDSEASAVLRT